MVTSNVAFAANYVGVSLGPSELDTTGFENAVATKLYGGIRRKNLGLEFAYLNLGDFKVRNASFAKIEASVIEISGVGYLPMTNQFDFFGKLGFISWDTKGVVNGVEIGNDSGSTYTYGFGLQLTVAEKVSLKLEYQYINDISNASDVSVSSILIGGIVNF